MRIFAERIKKRLKNSDGGFKSVREWHLACLLAEEREIEKVDECPPMGPDGEMCKSYWENVKLLTVGAKSVHD